MRKALLENIGHEDMIYHGYSGHLLLPAVRHFIRVRIEAPISLRVTMTMQRLSCDEETARDYISSADKERLKWARFVYAKDIRNPMLYDLSVNLGHMSLKAACGILEAILAEKDFQPTTESLAKIEQFTLATNIEEALLVDSRTANLEISAEVQDDGITLIGPYLDKKELATVLEIARSVSGVKEVHYTPGYKEKFG